MKGLALILLCLIPSCATFSGGEKKGYSGPEKYAHLFRQGGPRQIVDSVIIELSAELRQKGYLKPGQSLKWDWSQIKVQEKPTVTYWGRHPLISSHGRGNVHGYGTASGVIAIADDPNYTYSESFFKHEFGHVLLFHNKIRGMMTNDHHHTLSFFKRNGI